MFELLNKQHDKASFDCGNPIINHYLQHMASQHAKKGIAQTHVLADGKVIKAFYTLSNLHLDSREQRIKGYPNLIPAILIGRMGVSVDYQGQGLSKKLIAHALVKIRHLAVQTGIGFVVIDAKTDELVAYYERLGFKKTDNPYRLILAVAKLQHSQV
ncbi:GNAT family N-acetyltransferase [Faucicola mancuniensis]|uniref:GNAT family N-acetyltransferase n=1 Tax=Faucicola mancuniensis TaxID=1309795 RepID=UPI0039776107